MTTQEKKLSPRERRQCVQVCRLYYEADLTQEEIGGQLGLSRVKVNRILRLAREVGILEVRINGIEEPSRMVEDELLVGWRLKDAVVVADAPTDEGLTSQLAEGAAKWLTDQLKPGLRIGLGLGRTISKLPDSFHVEKSVDCSFTEIEGAASHQSIGFSSYNVTSRMGAIAGARTEFIYAPTFVTDRALRDRLVEEPSIANALGQARKSDIIIQSVGTVSESALLHIHGVVTDDDLKELRARGAVGDALGHYFDRDGRPISFRTDDIHVGLTLTDLKNVPTSVLVAGGAEKIPAIRGGLLGGFFNVLVTDIATAQKLIAEEKAS